jgi:hypothetical protein
MRLLLTITTGLLLLRLSAQAPCSILLETGDTIATKEYSTKGDSLGFPEGKVAKHDVLTLSTKKETFIFPVVTGIMKKLKLDDPAGPCRLARIYAEKYADSGIDLGEFRLPEPALAQNEEFRACWREQMLAHDIPTDAEGHLYAPDRRDQPPFVFTGNMVIQRDGDTVRVEKEFFASDSALQWFGGGRMPFDDVLLVVNKKGPCVIKEKHHNIVPTGFTAIDRSPCTQALIYAQIYAGSDGTLNDIPNLPKSLKDDPAFFECYYQEQARMAKKGEGWRAAAFALRMLNSVPR